MIEAMISGLFQVFMWPSVGFLFLGILVGIVMGAVPGLGGVMGLILLLPFTYAMEPVAAFALLLGMYTVTSTSDTIASVMLGIPGTSASQATILDGYPMAKKGEADRAFGAAFCVSAVGGVMGALIMAASLPILLYVILAFGVPEFLMLSVLGVTMVGAMSGNSVYKGLAVACLGILLTTVGFSQATGIPRYTFGIVYVLDGLPIVPLVMGLFAIPELLDLAVRNTSISRVSSTQVRSGILDGLRDAMREWWLTLRCAFLGTYIGMLPGLGPSIADWIAYGHAVQSAKDKSQFGKGDVRGVIAPEAANNATKSGALIPMVAFGIPGSLGTALLLSALVMQGLRPGQEMLTTKLDLTYMMIWSIVVANILVSMMLMVTSRQISKLAFVPGHLLVPGVLGFVLMGAWLSSAHLGDWIVCIGAGVVGYLMKQGGWPRPPLILALVLGPLIEQNLDLTVQVYPNFSWLFERPIALTILLIIFAVVAFSTVRSIRRRRSAEARHERLGDSEDPMFSLPLALALAAVLVVAISLGQGYAPRARQFPLFAASVGLLLLVPIISGDMRRLLSHVRRHGGVVDGALSSAQTALLGVSTAFLLSVIAILPATMLIGQKFTLALFALFYIRFWGGYPWLVAVFYAACTGLFVHYFYDGLMSLHFYPSLLF